MHMTSKVAITDTCRLAHWSGVPFRSPGDLLVSGIEPGSSTLHFYSSKKLFSFLPLSCAHTVASSRIAHFSGCFYPLYVHLNLIFFFFPELVKAISSYKNLYGLRNRLCFSYFWIPNPWHSPALGKLSEYRLNE